MKWCSLVFNPKLIVNFYSESFWLTLNLKMKLISGWIISLSVCVCEKERERVNVCVCVCVTKRERFLTRQGFKISNYQNHLSILSWGL